MFNIDRELEYTGNLAAVVKNVRVEGEHLYTTILQPGGYEDTVYFRTATGIYNGQQGSDNPLRLRAKSKTLPSNQFYLHAGHSAWAKEDWVKIPDKFDDGASAAEAMRGHNAKAGESKSPYRFMVKKEVIETPIPDFPNWIKERFETKEWTPVPWANEPWADADHGAHYSLQDDSKVAFYNGKADADRDVVTTMSPGRYLQAHYADVLSANEIRDWAVKHDSEADLKFAWTPDEIVAVYTHPNSPHSCMVYVENGTNWRAGGHMHPARVYGAGDLAIAYLERKGKIIARALVWPEKKIVGRVYGDIERFTARIQTEGYTLDARSHNVDSHGNGGFEGAKILRMPVGGRIDKVVMPYLDYKYSAECIEGDSKHFALTQSGGFQCLNTDGTAMVTGDDEDDYDACAEGECDCCTTCERCHSIVDRDDTTFINDEYWCDTCVSRHTTSCDYCDTRVPTREIQQTYHLTNGNAHLDACEGCTSDSESIAWSGRLQRHVDTDTGEYCEDCDDYFETDEHDCPHEADASEDDADEVADAPAPLQDA